MRISGVPENRAPWWARVFLFPLHRRRFGKALTPATVYAHCPSLLFGFNVMEGMIQWSGHIPTPLRSLVNVRVAQINGCHF